MSKSTKESAPESKSPAISMEKPTSSKRVRFFSLPNPVSVKECATAIAPYVVEKDEPKKKVEEKRRVSLPDRANTLYIPMPCADTIKKNPNMHTRMRSISIPISTYKTSAPTRLDLPATKEEVTGSSASGPGGDAAVYESSVSTYSSSESAAKNLGDVAQPNEEKSTAAVPNSSSSHKLEGDSASSVPENAKEEDPSVAPATPSVSTSVEVEQNPETAPTPSASDPKSVSTKSEIKSESSSQTEETAESDSPKVDALIGKSDSGIEALHDVKSAAKEDESEKNAKEDESEKNAKEDESEKNAKEDESEKNAKEDGSEKNAKKNENPEAGTTSDDEQSKSVSPEKAAADSVQSSDNASCIEAPDSADSTKPKTENETQKSLSSEDEKGPQSNKDPKDSEQNSESEEDRATKTELGAQSLKDKTSPKKDSAKETASTEKLASLTVASTPKNNNMSTAKMSLSGNLKTPTHRRVLSSPQPSPRINRPNTLPPKPSKTMFSASSAEFRELFNAAPPEDDTPTGQDLLDEGKKILPKLSGFLEKKSPSMFARWQKRYFTVAEYNIFYGAKEESGVNTMMDGLERGMNCMPLFVMFSIEPQLGNDGKDFCVRGRDMGKGRYREYFLRAPTRKERDVWVAGLRRHKEHLDKIVKCPDISLKTERAPMNISN